MVKVAVSRSAGAIRRGSNPLPRKACVAQMVEHLLCIGVCLRRMSYKQLKVLGSIPSIGKSLLGGTFFSLSYRLKKVL